VEAKTWILNRITADFQEPAGFSKAKEWLEIG
jgi:hypothetical protein